MARTHQKVAARPLPVCLGPGGSADQVAAALATLEGRWKLAILFRLFERPVWRFSELERDIGAASQKMLSQHLRELEQDRLVRRTDHGEIPPRVDYRLTPLGEDLRPALAALRDFGGRVQAAELEIAAATSAGR